MDTLEAACMAKEFLTKLLQKTLCPFKILPTPPGTVTADGKRIHNTFSIDRAALASYKTQGNDGTGRDCDKQKAGNGRTKYEINDVNARTFRDFELPHIAKHFRTAKR